MGALVAITRDELDTIEMEILSLQTKGFDALTKDERQRHSELHRKLSEGKLALKQAERTTRNTESINRLLGETKGGPLHRPDGSTESRTWLPSMAEFRAAPPQSTLNGPDGAFTIPAPIWNIVFDYLRPRSVVLQSGATVVRMESKTLRLPGVVSSSPAVVVAENATISTGAIVFSEKVMEAVKLVAQRSATMEWFQDSIPTDGGRGRELLGQDLVKAIAEGVDRIALAGTGVAPEPYGLATDPLVPNTPAVGASVTLDHILGLFASLQSRNAIPDAVFLNPANFAELAASKTTTGEYLLTREPSEAAPLKIFGVNAYVSTFMPADVVVAAEIGRALVLGMRQSVSLDLNPYSDSAWSKACVDVRAVQRVGVTVRDPQAAQKLTLSATARATPEPPARATSEPVRETRGK